MKIDETSYIEDVAKATGSSPFYVNPGVSDFLNDLSDLVWTQEEPFASLSIYGQYKVMQLAHLHHAKVLLDGQGGDEVLAGYEKYFGAYLMECLLNLRIREALLCARSRRRKTISDMRHMFKTASFALSEDDFEVRRDIGSIPTAKSVEPLAPARLEGNEILNRTLLADLLVNTIPQYLRYEDKNSMRWGIESRVPFLDHRLVEFAFSLPSRWKLGNGTTKKILRDAMTQILPDRISGRHDKIGFSTPDADMMRSPDFSEMAQELMGSASFRSRRYWRADDAERLYRDHLQGGKDHSALIWRILNTELWLRMFIDEPTRLEKRSQGMKMSDLL